MATKILIPTPLRPFTDRKDAVEADGKTVGELLADLTDQARRASRRTCTTTKASCAASSTSTSTTKTSGICRRSRRRSTRATPSASFRRSPAARLTTRQRRRPPLPELTNDDIKRYSRHLIMPEVGVRRAAEAQGREGPVHRRRRTGIAGRAVSCRRRRRHDRHRRLRRRGLQQPAAADSARDAGCRPLEARLREGSAARASTRTSTSTRTTRRCRPRTRSSSSRPTTSSSTAPTIFRRAIS